MIIVLPGPGKGEEGLWGGNHTQPTRQILNFFLSL